MMDWNLASPNKLSNNSSSSMNPMAAVFYARPSLSGLEEQHHHHHHTSSPAMRDGGLLYGFEAGSSDQESLDVEASEQDPLQHVEKKRRLTVEQVRSLELNFEIENKLEPERKKQLAHELGLQPRQVAVWFQNRRARWKTKQLERDYDALKASHDNLLAENKRLQAEVASLTVKLEAKNSCFPSKEEASAEEATMNNMNINGKRVLDMEVECVAATRMITVKTTGGTAGGTTATVLSTAAAAATQTSVTVPTAAAAARRPSNAKVDQKEGSPCSDGYTSEILDADYSASEAVPVVGENVLPFEQQQQQQQQQSALFSSVSAFFQETTATKKEESDGMVYDPHLSSSSSGNAAASQVLMIPLKFEDGLLFNDCYFADDQIAPWWS